MRKELGSPKHSPEEVLTVMETIPVTEPFLEVFRAYTQGNESTYVASRNYESCVLAGEFRRGDSRYYMVISSSFRRTCDLKVYAASAENEASILQPMRQGLDPRWNNAFELLYAGKRDEGYGDYEYYLGFVSEGPEEHEGFEEPRELDLSNPETGLLLEIAVNLHTALSHHTSLTQSPE